MMPIAVTERVADPAAAVFAFAAVAEQPIIFGRAIHSEKLLGVYLGQIQGRGVEPILVEQVQVQVQLAMPIDVIERVAAAVFAAVAAE